MEEKLIAPCGMNCGICSRYLALRNDIRSKGKGWHSLLRLPETEGDTNPGRVKE